MGPRDAEGRDSDVLAPVTCWGWSREKAVPVPRGHSPPMVGSQGKLSASLFLTSELRPSSLGEVCLVWSLITWATLRASAWRQQKFLSVFHNSEHGHVRDGDGTYSGLGLACILLPLFSLVLLHPDPSVLAVKHADFFVPATDVRPRSKQASCCRVELPL